MKQYADEFGFTMRLHDIRHTFVTLMLKRTRPNVAQELAGHKKASTTLDIYGHVLPGEKEDAVSDMKSTLRKRKKA
ncbi:hypothetical protein SDC9_156174 [bioreactor metagenome]|uniref:Tyr recombinase domain-containing protein n=1 Tax=bioreactor metagenome TaxID=1076179 RepID=A0A645F3G6_9ZZZZ